MTEYIINWLTGGIVSAIQGFIEWVWNSISNAINSLSQAVINAIYNIIINPIYGFINTIIAGFSAKLKGIIFISIAIPSMTYLGKKLIIEPSWKTGLLFIASPFIAYVVAEFINSLISGFIRPITISPPVPPQIPRIPQFRVIELLPIDSINIDDVTSVELLERMISIPALDNINISDITSVELITVPPSEIPVTMTDYVGITDYTTISLLQRILSVSAIDNISISDLTTVELITAGLIEVNITDNIDVSDLTTIELITSWLDGWGYRKSATVEGSTSGSVTDYQIRVVVHYGAGVDNGEHVYLNGKCRADFGDVRFTDSDGVTLLNYWIESKVDGDYAVIWVKIPYIPTYPDTRLFYIYYGKSDATSISNGDATFILFDDFTVKNTSKWQFLGTYPPVIENGELKTSSSSGATSYVWSIPTFPCDKGYKMSVKGRSPSGGTWRGVCRFRNGEISVWYPADPGGELQYGCSYGGYASTVRVASNITLTHKHVAHFHPGIIVRWFYDGTKVFETTNPTCIFPLDPNIILKVEIGDAFADSGYGTIYWDDFFIAKHIHPEPTITAWGIEESL
ncbi:MAG: DUF2341 domain-containing protein [Candidatus Bathyarchaeia archaeon]